VIVTPHIAAPAVGVGGFVVAEVLPDEGGECVGRNIGDQTKPNPATASTTLLALHLAARHLLATLEQGDVSSVSTSASCPRRR
jgi:hypothetical protein